jgi:hypothetical protein
MDATACLGKPHSADGQIFNSARRELGSSFEPQVLPPPPRIRLAHLAREAATRSLEALIQRQYNHRDDGPHCGAELLAVLTFSYGTGIYTLERICEALRNDVLFCSLIGRRHPYPDTIRAFRRQERTALRSSLRMFFQMASELRREHTHPEMPAEECAWLKALRLYDPLPTQPDSLEKLVNDRVNQATWIDRMMLDY